MDRPVPSSTMSDQPASTLASVTPRPRGLTPAPAPASSAAVSSGVARASLLCRPSGLVAEASTAVAELFETSPDALVGRRMVELFHPDDRDLVNRVRDRIRHGRADECELAVRWVDTLGVVHEIAVRFESLIDERGSSGIVLLIGAPEPGRPTSASPWRDGLTGLPGASLMADRLGHALERSRRDARAVGVVVLAIDDVESLRRVHGRSGADLVVLEIADRAQRCTRPSDTIARVGPDHLIAVLDGLDGVAVLDAVAARLESAVSLPYTIRRAEAAVSLTVTAVLARAGDDPRTVLERAIPTVSAGSAGSTSPPADSLSALAPAG